jgi:lysophospholipase L1-like esterase
MKTILCFGDSNTWGAIPANTQNRYPRTVRWPGVLQGLLGSDYYVIEEGLNGRTTVIDDPIETERCGKYYLTPCLLSHRPLDGVVLMLGTNDLKPRFSYSAYNIARGAALLVDMIQRSESGINNRSPKVLLVAPAPLGRLSGDADEFEGGEAKSIRLAGYYAQHAQELGCDFLDAGKIIKTSDLDGVHLEPGEHKKLAEAVATWVKSWA